jgi:phosphatidylinositol phospholipase C delta
LRGCRCVEIDVHNGEIAIPKSSSSSENLTTSQTPRGSSPASSKVKHKRHISESTFSRGLASVVEKVDGKYGSAKLKWNRLRANSKSKSPEGRGGNLVVPIIKADAEPEKQVTIKELMNGEPLVLHGWTFTAPVGFRAVCKTIREDGFRTSSLPIIVSLEVHADLGQQQKMVDIMKEEWAGYLIEAPHEGCNPDERLPLLEDLQNKILVKVKKAIADRQDLTPANTASTLSPMPSRVDTESIHSGSEDDRSAPKKKVKICEALSNLGVYTHSEHFTTFEAPSAKSPPHIFSIGESQILDLHEKSRTEMFAHNRDFFMRAYPAGFRIDSSNLDPSIFWRKGVQMVALNWQTLDEGMMLNEGMFAGEHGWVLKPPGYRSDPNEAVNYKTCNLKITVFAGQHIPIPDKQTERGFHPYVRCELHVEKEKEAKLEGGGEIEKEEYKKKTPHSKGDHPDWGQEGHVMTFPTIERVVEELSFVRLVVLHSRYSFLCVIT